VFLETPGEGRIVVGDRVRINAGAFLVASARVSIGDDCLIGEYVSIRDANHGTRAGRPMREQPETAREIVIERDVWIGRGAAILPGVRIGQGAVVGANSTVTKDVDTLTIVAGSPARAIRRRESGDANAGSLHAGRDEP
jgi:acetyltransferase-like isoleucine patch superfamily enzyme